MGLQSGMKTAAQCGISKYNISNPYTGAESFKDCKNIKMFNFLFEELKMFTTNKLNQFNEYKPFSDLFCKFVIIAFCSYSMHCKDNM